MGGFRWGLSGNVGYVFPGNVFRPDRDLRFRHAEGVHGVPHIGRQHKKASGKFAGGFVKRIPALSSASRLCDRRHHRCDLRGAWLR